MTQQPHTAYVIGPAQSPASSLVQFLVSATGSNFISCARFIYPSNISICKPCRKLVQFLGAGSTHTTPASRVRSDCLQSPQIAWLDLKASHHSSIPSSYKNDSRRPYSDRSSLINPALPDLRYPSTEVAWSSQFRPVGVFWRGIA